MRLFILSSLVTLSLALPQSAPPVTCGTNERGLPRVEGESWMEDCNRCRCLPNNRPGCTRKFCGVPEFIQPQEDVVTETRTGNSNNGDVQCGTNERGLPRVEGESWKEDCNTCGCRGGRPSCTRIFCSGPPSPPSRTGNNDGGVHFPGATEDRSSAVKTCKDKEGNDRQQGDSWMQECNTCGCGPNGVAVCTQRFCINIEQLTSDDVFLFSEDTSRDSANIVQCQQSGISNCRPVTIDTEHLTTRLQLGQYVKFIAGSDIEMQLRREPEDKSRTRLSYNFMLTDGGEATFTVNTATGGVYGSVKPLTGDIHYFMEATNPSGSVIYERNKDYFNQFED